MAVLQRPAFSNSPTIPGKKEIVVPEEMRWTSPLGLEGLLTNPGTPGGKDGGEANSTELHEGVQGAGGEAAAGRRQGAVGGGDGAWHWHRAAQPVAHRAPGGRLGRGTGRPQGGAGGNAATEARGEAPRRGGGDPPQGGGFFRQGDRVTKFSFVSAERTNHAVATLCRVIGASVSGFYAWLHAIPTVQSRAEAEAEPREQTGRGRGRGERGAARPDRPRLRPPAGLRLATRPRRAAPGRAAAFAPAHRAADARDGALGPPGPPPHTPNHEQPP